MNKLTPKEFNYLFADKKIDYLYDKGKFVTERFVNQDYIVKTWFIDDFYVEVVFNLKINTIEAIYALDYDREEDWDGLLQTIDLRDYI